MGLASTVPQRKWNSNFYVLRAGLFFFFFFLSKYKQGRVIWGILLTIDHNRREDGGSIKNASKYEVGSGPLDKMVHTKVRTS
jgi:hypothetical protein